MVYIIRISIYTMIVTMQKMSEFNVLWGLLWSAVDFAIFFRNYFLPQHATEKSQKKFQTRYIFIYFILDIISSTQFCHWSRPLNLNLHHLADKSLLLFWNGRKKNHLI